jgi:hypothetical protein
MICIYPGHESPGPEIHPLINFTVWIFHAEEVFAVSTFRETSATEASGDNHEQ